MEMETEAETQLAWLVSQPSITDNISANDAVLDYAEKYFAQRGMFCQRDRFDVHGTLLASTRPNNLQSPRVMLYSHVDVVTASKEAFNLTQDGDKLLGRGVYDMKFALAGYMQLVNDLKEQLAQYDFAIMITTDEENVGRDGVNGARSLINKGCRPSVCIMPDSTAPGWDIERLAKGYWHFDLIAEGKTAHGSRPWEGDSASVKLVNALRALNKQFSKQGPKTDTLNIGILHGGHVYNQVPSRVHAGIDIRLVDERSYIKTLRAVEKICKSHDVTFVEKGRGHPVRTDLKNPFVQKYMNSVEEVTGKKPEGRMSLAGSDASHFAEVGIPCILSCPEGGGHHGEHEWLSRKSFNQFVPLLKTYLDKVAKTTKG